MVVATEVREVSTTGGSLVIVTLPLAPPTVTARSNGVLPPTVTVTSFASVVAKPEAVACDYPPYILDKIVSTKFATDGGAAFTLVKNFKWTNLDQSTVSELIANKGMTPEEAGQKWVEDNPDKWKAWMP